MIRNLLSQLLSNSFSLSYRGGFVGRRCEGNLHHQNTDRAPGRVAQRQFHVKESSVVSFGAEGFAVLYRIQIPRRGWCTDTRSVGVGDDHAILPARRNG